MKRVVVILLSVVWFTIGSGCDNEGAESGGEDSTKETMHQSMEHEGKGVSDSGRPLNVGVPSDSGISLHVAPNQIGLVTASFYGKRQKQLRIEGSGSVTPQRSCMSGSEPQDLPSGDWFIRPLFYPEDCGQPINQPTPFPYFFLQLNRISSAQIVKYSPHPGTGQDEEVMYITIIIEELDIDSVAS